MQADEQSTRVPSTLDKRVLAVLVPWKSPALAITLVLGLGGFGLLYVSRRGAVFSSALTVAGVIGAYVEFHGALILLASTWTVSVFWAAIAVHQFNRSLVERARGKFFDARGRSLNLSDVLAE